VNPSKPVSLQALLDGWAAEKQPTQKTIYSWKRVLEQLGTFVGHNDAARLTPENLLHWKTTLLEAGLRTKTIRDSKIAPLRASLQWGVDNRKFAMNPASRVLVEVRGKMAERIRGFTDEEAALILRQAATHQDSVRRWVPLLCAYSGARISEVCQLRGGDIFQHDGVWCMKFDPEAGALKNVNSERAVPLHPAIVTSGFLEFVASQRPGPLFPGLAADRFGNRGGNGTKIIGRWVRGLGLTDARLSPSHSWRHRFKTLGRRHGLMLEILNALTGHHRKTEADWYGEFPVEALHRELSKIPPVGTL
jgi:integrase